MKLTKKDHAYFNAAKAMSNMSDFKNIHIGSVVVYNHHIISSGCNSRKSHPLQKELNKERYNEDNGHLLHSETASLIPLLNRKDINWKKVDIYLYREYKSGELAPSRPCPSCQKLIKELGIKRVHYTMQDSFVYEEFN